MNTLAFLILGCAALAAAKPHSLRKAPELQKPGCPNPCNAIEDRKAFFGCVIQEAKSAERRFGEVFREQTGKDLFEEGELEDLWKMRYDKSMSKEEKIAIELAVEELAKKRFIGGVNLTQLSPDIQKEIEDLFCTYKSLRADAYERMRKKK